MDIGGLDMVSLASSQLRWLDGTSWHRPVVPHSSQGPYDLAIASGHWLVTRHGSQKNMLHLPWVWQGSNLPCRQAPDLQSGVPTLGTSHPSGAPVEHGAPRL